MQKSHVSFRLKIYCGPAKQTTLGSSLQKNNPYFNYVPYFVVKKLKTHTPWGD